MIKVLCLTTLTVLFSSVLLSQSLLDSDKYSTRISLTADIELNLFTSRMFRVRTSKLEGEKFPDRNLIPFAIGHVDNWDKVRYQKEEGSAEIVVTTGKIVFRFNKRDKSWTVSDASTNALIHPSDEPIFGMFKNGYTLFDAASAFNEKNNNSRYAHWFFNPETGRYIDTYLQEDKMLDQYFIYGPDYPSLFYQFNQLVGPEPLLPKKAYGFFQTQHVGCEGNQSQLMELARELRARDIPADNLIIDFEWGDACEANNEVTWGSRLTWSDNYSNPLPPQRMLQVLDSMRFDVMLIRHNAPLFKNRTGQGWTETVSEEGIWWQEYFKRMDEGVDGTWQDTRQNDITDSYIWQETQDHLGPGKRVLFLGCRKMQSVNPWDFRFSTVPVNQVIGARRYPFDWTGDASFSWNELEWQIAAITNTHGAMKGVTYVTSDAVGANWKIQARWNQFADFSTISRSHNPRPWSGTINTRNFENKIRITGRDTVTVKQETVVVGSGKTAEESIRRHRKERYKLLPYIYSYAIENYLTGMPITRPMVLAFPGDYLCNANNWPYQYMFGNELLVAPVYGDFASMEIYLPRDYDWIDFWSREIYPGGGLITYDTKDINKLPLFIRAGAILPTRQDMNWIDVAVPDQLTFYVYPSDSVSTYSFFEDDNRSTKYQQGEYGRTLISCDNTTADEIKIAFEPMEGSFRNKPESRSIKLKVFSAEPPTMIQVSDLTLAEYYGENTDLPLNNWRFDANESFTELTMNIETGRKTEVKMRFQQ